MTRTLHGTVHGKTIEFEEDLGVAEGQVVEVQVKIVLPAPQKKPTMSEAQVKIYEILGERYDSGFTDLAERHNDHQPSMTCSWILSD
jgi:hypothetical protein